MHDWIKSPVLVPFGRDALIFEQLVGHEVYLYPAYKFWGRNIQLMFDKSLNNAKLNYIRKKINDDYSGIIKRSKYFRVFKKLFDIKTAEFLDKIYQIELDQKSKDILVFVLTSFIEIFMDDNSKCKNLNIDLELLDGLLKDPFSFTTKPKTHNVTIKLITEPIGLTKFRTVYDSVPRIMRMYDRNYLGFIELFSGVKEYLVSYEDILKNTVRNNLMHKGNMKLNGYPNEICDKVVDILTDEGLNCYSFCWRKPDIKVINITKGITKDL